MIGIPAADGAPFSQLRYAVSIRQIAVANGFQTRHSRITLSVAVLIPCYNHARLLRRALASAEHQTVPALEIIVVDDGSEADLGAIVAKFPRARLLRQTNLGLAAARNKGLDAATAEKVVFLDADDILLPNAIEAGLNCFRENPDAAFIYGAFVDVNANGDTERFNPMRDHQDLIRCNWVAMIAAAMFDRLKVADAGGFDESLRMCEDWDLMLRLSRRHRFAHHARPVARYVKHEANMSNDVATLRGWIEVVRQRERARGLDAAQQQAWAEGRKVWDSFYPAASPLARLRRLAQRLTGGHPA